MKIRRIALWIYSLAVMALAALFLILVIRGAVAVFPLLSDGSVSSICEVALIFCLYVVLSVLMIMTAETLLRHGVFERKVWGIASSLFAILVVYQVICTGFHFWDIACFLLYLAMPLAKRYLAPPEASKP